MTVPFVLMPDPKHDLVLEREIAVPVELVWKAWTVPEHMMQWFTPKPWKTVECSVDLRPGGRSDLVMESPEGQRFPNRGCYLVVEPNRRLVFTSLRALLMMGYFAHPVVLRHLRLAPYAIATPVVEADLLYPRVGAHPATIRFTEADLTPYAPARPLDLDGPLHPDVAEARG